MNGKNQFEAEKSEESRWRAEGCVSVKPLVRLLRLDLKKISRRGERQSERTPDAADRWLTDNQYLLAMAGKYAQDQLRGQRPVPALAQSDGTSRILALARWICAVEPLPDQTGLGALLDQVQQTEPLEERELRLLPAALHLVCVHDFAASLDEQSIAVREECFSKRISALRHWNSLDFQRVTEETSRIHLVFLQDPTGDYPHMTSQSRLLYRLKLEQLARKRQTDEQTCAQSILTEAGKGHIGFLLFPKRTEFARNVYFPALTLVSLVLSLLAAFFLGYVWLFLLVWIPLFTILKGSTDAVLLRVVPPRPVFRMALPRGLPATAKTLLVKTVLLGTGHDLELVSDLERICLANRDCGEHLAFGLLADFPERNTPLGQGERDAIRQVEAALDQLNAAYQGQFFLFYRAPGFQHRDGTYSGWERKRGALLELAGFLRGRDSEIEVHGGDCTRLSRVRYLVTLDGDTQTGVGSIRALAGAMLHPLNRPVVDQASKTVGRGYGILQPLIRPELASTSGSALAHLFAGGAGTEPYRGLCGELCHDLFDEASFSGKGIVDIDCFLDCLTGRFPDRRVLSHDILEGAYLRCGCVSQISFFDRFPAKTADYYQRQHRWVRGDWQNLAWICHRVPMPDGTRQKTVISDISRWKLADNLRRSLLPVAQLGCLVSGIWLGTIPVVIALFSLCLDAVLSFFDRAALCHALRRFHSNVWPQLGRVLLTGVVCLALLPVDAWTNLSAAVTALWRVAVSHRNLLQWTPAGTGHRRGSGIARVCFPAVIAGAGLCLLATHPLAELLGLLWIMSPLVVWILDQKPPESRLHSSERAFLFHEAEQIWGYFADFLTPERNYLPPDNFQLRPYLGAAERTSPTNIGFALLSCLAAIDLDLEPKQKALQKISGMLDTVERLEKWQGNLYNWYHTVTCAPMEPRVISSVDSGNLCGALIALAEGLKQLGETALSERALTLLNETDLRMLYDTDKHLFYISYTPAEQTWSDAHYDLMASEARLLSYVALAEGWVDRRHWKALSRVQLSAHRYQGMASWFGTMFEYFMPHLLLPLPRDSFLYESLAFCACEQLRTGREQDAPWGVSESAVPQLDRGGSYGYRANGVASTALCGERQTDYVVAPYATFLSLSILPHQAIANLHRLRQDGLDGKYGLYEAANYQNGGITPVKSWMVHHLGMSLVALDNALNDRVMVRYFLSRPSMAAFRSLLEEAVPQHSRPIDLRKVGSGMGNVADKQAQWQLEGSGVGKGKPVCALLQAGTMSAVVCGNGAFWLLGDEVNLLDRRNTPAFFWRQGNRITQLFPCKPGADVHWRFRPECCELERELNDMTVKLTLKVKSNGTISAEVIVAPGAASTKGSLIFTVHPQLVSEREYLAHPTFCGLTVEIAREAYGVVFRRRSREPAVSALRLGWQKSAVDCSIGADALNRQIELGLPGGDPAAVLEQRSFWSGGERCEAEFSFCLGDEARCDGKHHRAESPRRMPSSEVCRLGWRLLPFLLFSGVLGQTGNPAPQRMLWPFGVSGDDPILFGHTSGQDLTQWNEVHAYLSRGGIRFDLVFLAENIAQERAKCETAGIHLGGQSGVHLAEDTPEILALFAGMSGACLDELPEQTLFFPREQLQNGWPLPPVGGYTCRWQQDAFCLNCQNGIPPVRWSIPLTNGRFGYLGMETGGGFLWSGNARLFQITPWDNAPYAHQGPEQLEVQANGKRISLFAGEDGLPCRVTYGAGFMRWKKELGNGAHSTVTAFVPWEENERLLLVCLDGCPEDCVLFWQMELQMGERPTQGLWAQAVPEGDEIRLRNPVTERDNIFLSVSDKYDIAALPKGDNHLLKLSCRPNKALVLRVGAGKRHVSPEEAVTLLSGTVDRWRRDCGVLQVETPDEALNHYLSFWGLYQVMASRMLGRTSVYQCGGAYGFRDQLQDCCALIQTRPDLVREHILRCCRHQFIEGDVMHWWHEVPGSADAGVRTRISDDLLWLPYTVSVWLEETGDAAFLGEQSAYLAGDKLHPGEKDRYCTVQLSSLQESVYQHCVRAVECLLGRGVGEHGLCLVGTGDWNDGMDKVGAAGKGESVWLTWFASWVLSRFARVCSAMGDDARKKHWLELSERFRHSAEKCWDGDWFLRGYFDSGEALGSKINRACQLDSVAQSFAVFAGAERGKAVHALEQAQKHLLEDGGAGVRLLTPAFDVQDPYPGYIARYRPGARENGGQYTHAAVWLALAWLELGQADRGYEILRLILPEGQPHQRYWGDPFVLAGDVSMEPGREGMCGWSWYTGAAGWYVRSAVQALLGLRFRDDRLYVQPCLPSEWNGYRATLKLEDCVLEIQVVRGSADLLTLDGKVTGQGIHWRALSGTHRVRFEFL